MIRNIITEINPQEVNGRKLEGSERYKTKIIVQSHFDNDEWVIMKVDGKEYTYNAKELKRAIDNATYWGIK